MAWWGSIDEIEGIRYIDAQQRTAGWTGSALLLTCPYGRGQDGTAVRRRPLITVDGNQPYLVPPFVRGGGFARSFREGGVRRRKQIAAVGH